MISVDEALEVALSHAQASHLIEIPTVSSVGFVLAEEVSSDIDSPPHDKAMMDGYAIHVDDLDRENVQLQIIEEVTAGALPTKKLFCGQATRIMTGAPIPAGVSAVVMVERTEAVPDSSQQVRVNSSGMRSGDNILPRATSMAVGQVVLSSGTLIRPIEVGMLAEVGKTHVQAITKPTVAVMTSGNELVSADQQPGPGQIRNSNNPMLVALAERAGAVVRDLGIARDEKESIRALVEQGLQHDVLILSGGVSAGVLDLIPAVLADAGVQQVFHKVNLKPGKPLWFGVHEMDDQKTLVFGLPGNPVSGLVCFELFVRAAIAKMRGLTEVALPSRSARLSKEYQQRGDRPVYFPGVLSPMSDEFPTATPLPWHGSADLMTLSQANCLIYFPAGEQHYEVGNVVTAYQL